MDSSPHAGRVRENVKANMMPDAHRNKLRVALVMPSLNEASTVAASMQCIRASTRQPDEIVVVDGGSSDATNALLQQHADAGLPVRVLVRPGMLPGAARNEGAQASDSDVLLFLDFGNVIDPRWIEAMARPFEADPGIEAVGGLYEPMIHNEFERCVAAIQYAEPTVFAQLSREQQLERMPPEVRLGGLSMAVRRDTFLRLGGQPHWLRAGEDWLFGMKLLASRAPVGVALDARLYHHMRPTPGELFRQNRLYSRGEARLGVGMAGHARKAAVYLGVVTLLVAGLAWWPAAVAGVALAAAYVEHSGFSRMRRVFGSDSLQGRRHLLALAVVTRDMGALAGYVRGSYERLTQPHWREEQRRYLGTG
jgi:glycosyltransferase involved in cell wall biosynthesis